MEKYMIVPNVKIFKTMTQNHVCYVIIDTKKCLITNKMYALKFIQMHQENVTSLTFHHGLGIL